jgi:TIR domain-containing protein/WD40 domain-containing protein
MNDVFISYSRKDKIFVERLFAALEQQGHDAWVDWDDIEYSEDWWQKIQKGILTSNNFVFIMSPHSVRSKVCFDEVKYADDMNKRIIPVIIQDIDDPIDQERMHPALQRHNWFFFRPEDDFNSALSTLLEIIRREPEYVGMHTRLLVNAQEWIANDRNHSLLLRGDNLRWAEKWLQSAATKSPKPTKLHSEYIRTSRQADSSRRRRTGGILLFGLAIIIVLAVAAFTMLGQNQRESQERRSIAQAATALELLENGQILDALSEVIKANQMIEPPAESVAALREIASSPAPRAIFSGDTALTSLVFLPDMTRIIAAYSDGSLRLWDAAVGVGIFTRPLSITLEGEWHSEAINAVDVDSQGRYVVSASCGQRDPNSTQADNCVESEVFLWELVDDVFILRNRLAPQDNLRFTQSNPIDVDVKDFITGNSIVEVVIAFTNAQGPIELRYSLDDSGNFTQPWAGYSQAGFTHRGMMSAVDHNLGDDYLSGDTNGNLRYVQGLGGVAQSLSAIRGQTISALASSPIAMSGRSSRPILVGYANGQIFLRSRNEILNNLELQSPINDLDYNANGDYALVALENGQLVLLNMENNATTIQAILRWQPDIPFSTVDYANPSESDYLNYAVSGSADGSLILWDMRFNDLSAYEDANSLLAWVEENRYIPSSASD